MKYESNLHIFSQRLSEAMEKKGIDMIALYNAINKGKTDKDGLEKEVTDKDDPIDIIVKTRSVRNWLNEKNLPRTVNDVLKICEVLDCSMDYLFGYDDCSTHDIKGIHEAIGLSEDSIVKLCEVENQRKGNSRYISEISEKTLSGLDCLFASNSIGYLARSIIEYNEALAEYNNSLNDKNNYERFKNAQIQLVNAKGKFNEALFRIRGVFIKDENE